MYVLLSLVEVSKRAGDSVQKLSDLIPHVGLGASQGVRYRYRMETGHCTRCSLHHYIILWYVQYM